MQVLGGCCVCRLQHLFSPVLDRITTAHCPLPTAHCPLPTADVDTRRRAACDLVRGLCKFFEAEVTSIFSDYVSTLLQVWSWFVFCRSCFVVCCRN